MATTGSEHEDHPLDPGASGDEDGGSGLGIEIGTIISMDCMRVKCECV